ncbi:MAG: sigma-54-dependent Fis family transcriptional regulator [Nitrospirae bacterium]|jgi:DNA-binding NtrC family response regulator|nr:sigma-54-dependent Fis family transcriptional regulator [Nitrospirota bacterium]
MIEKIAGKVLVVDDEPNAIKVLSAILLDAGFNIISTTDSEKAVKIVSEEDIDVVVTDLKMPGTDGMQLFDYIVENHPDIPVIFLTAYGTVESAVQAMTRGAFYYFIKPPDYLKLKSIISKALEQRYLKKELENLCKRFFNEKNKKRITGSTPQMLKVMDTIEAIKDSVSSVLIFGETGTGKELIANALHFTSKRKDGHFVPVNCAAIPRELIESELFGSEKGAYTGSVSKRVGKIEEASGGTLFLDEIGELDLSVQAKLLRVLQESEIERLGSNEKIKVDFRLISSTNRDLEEEVEAGKFRKDLFYRINVITLYLPPLRERISDISLLVSEFVKEFCFRENKKILAISNEVMEVFQKHDWPGNIRQLKNVIERAVVLSKEDTITLKELPEDFIQVKEKADIYSNKTLKDLEKQAIQNILTECEGNKSKSAKMLGISRKAFYKKLKEFHIVSF